MAMSCRPIVCCIRSSHTSGVSSGSRFANALKLAPVDILPRLGLGLGPAEDSGSCRAAPPNSSWEPRVLRDVIFGEIPPLDRGGRGKRLPPECLGDDGFELRRPPDKREIAEGRCRGGVADTGYCVAKVGNDETECDDGAEAAKETVDARARALPVAIAAGPASPAGIGAVEWRVEPVAPDDTVPENDVRTDRVGESYRPTWRSPSTRSSRDTLRSAGSGIGDFGAEA